MTCPDAGHHQDDARSEALEQRPDVGARKFQLCERVSIGSHGAEPVAFARSGTGAWYSVFPTKNGPIAWMNSDV